MTHWSSRLLAAELGISNVKVADVWREWKLQPWRTESFKFSTDPQLFSFISVNWRGKPLASYETVLELIGATTTRTGLSVTASRDTGTYPTGEKISDKDMGQLEKTRVTRHDWHPDWNYTIHAAGKPETQVI